MWRGRKDENPPTPLYERGLCDGFVGARLHVKRLNLMIKENYDHLHL